MDRLSSTCPLFPISRKERHAFGQHSPASHLQQSVLFGIDVWLFFDHESAQEDLLEIVQCNMKAECQRVGGQFLRYASGLMHGV